MKKPLIDKNIEEIRSYPILFSPITHILQTQGPTNYTLLKEKTIEALVAYFPQLRSDYFELTYEKTGANIFDTLFYFALLNLKEPYCGLIDKKGKAQTAIYRLTPMGEAFLKTLSLQDPWNRQEVEPFIKKSFPIYWEKCAHNPKNRTRKKHTQDPIPADREQEPVEQEDESQNWEEMYSQHKQAIKEEILDTINQMDPIHVEKFIGVLLYKMGYGKSYQTPATRDGGIDLIIDKDPLGIEKIHVQVKRYQADNKIGIDAINSFIGAKDDRIGLFVTTSDFSKEAKERAKKAGLALMNGASIVDNILKYQVGVKISQSYHIFDIDKEYFQSFVDS